MDNVQWIMYIGLGVINKGPFRNERAVYKWRHLEEGVGGFIKRWFLVTVSTKLVSVGLKWCQMVRNGPKLRDGKDACSACAACAYFSQLCIFFLHAVLQGFCLFVHFFWHFCAFLHDFDHFLRIFCVLIFLGLKFCVCYFVSFFHLCRNGPKSSQMVPKSLKRLHILQIVTNGPNEHRDMLCALVSGEIC